MVSAYTILYSVITIIISIIVLIVRSKIKRQAELLSQQIRTNYTDVIPRLLSKFKGKYISKREELEYTRTFSECYEQACVNARYQRLLLVFFRNDIDEFISNYRKLPILVRDHNENHLRVILRENCEFFDTCLQYPLDEQQRRSIVSEEDNCLVISSAGSGKTSSIVGKVKYLIEKKEVAPDRILLVSYTNKAAAELSERINIKGLGGCTFHKLALDLIGKYKGIKPTICDNAYLLIKDAYKKLSGDPDFSKALVAYFTDYQDFSTDEEKEHQAELEKLSEIKTTRLKALFPDMDGRTIYVKSKQEQTICLILSSLGVKYRYEESYEHAMADELHSQYKPDFSIYYSNNGLRKRIYLEHFGVDDRGRVPHWFAKHRNISYQEANKKYNDGISWKREIHSSYGTTLLETTSADFKHYSIRDKIKSMLDECGVPIREIPEDKLLSYIMPEDSRQEKALLGLISTFIMLLKSSGKTVDEILSEAQKADDKRSVYMINNLFARVYDEYIKLLAGRNEIDFTDAILTATKIANEQENRDYDYIIVDEFQDISFDRYRFLLALRKGNPPAQLYCVGDDWQSIYRFSGSDITLFTQFSKYFGYTDVNKIETTYRFGQPLVAISSNFVQKNTSQIRKNIHPFSEDSSTSLSFCPYTDINSYVATIEKLVLEVPDNKSVFLIGRYSFDDFFLSKKFSSIKEGNRFYYIVANRKIEFLTAHKSKGLEADYVIILQANNDVSYGFPSKIADDSSLKYILAEGETYPFAEERRLFYVAITRAKKQTFVLYNKNSPSVFVDEILHPEKDNSSKNAKHRNANKRWTSRSEHLLLTLQEAGYSIKQISEKMGRSQTAIIMRLDQLKKQKKKDRRHWRHS
ncbi:MAG: UvrD-helicase domain-containing protein [Alistipes sp.]|nr:UvrD-helicase domain-containing protein [Alistipes sp.]